MHCHILSCPDQLARHTKEAFQSLWSPVENILHAKMQTIYPPGLHNSLSELVVDLHNQLIYLLGYPCFTYRV